VRSSLKLLILAGLVGVAAGWLASRYVLDRDGGSSNPLPEMVSPQELVGQRRPDFTLGAADGRLVSAADFDGQVTLLNFWATWCLPCREEMPMLAETHAEYAARGVAIVGIALDDVQAARDFADELGITYPILVGTADVMSTAMIYGNRAGLLPYSVLVDRSGVVRRTWLGVLEQAELQNELDSLL
jgi:peroxiredoxin